MSSSSSSQSYLGEPLPAPAKKNVVVEQPAPAQNMTTRKGQEQSAMRLRGGCVPCPVRY